MVVLLTVAGRVEFAVTNTMRVGYYHTGNVSQEMFGLDEVVLKPLPWLANADRAADDADLATDPITGTQY